MKILYIITLPDLGGAQTHLLEVLIFMQRGGHEVIVVTGREGWLTEQLTRLNISYVILPELVREINPYKDIKAVWQLKNIIHRLHPDIIHCHSSKAGILGRIAAWHEKIPSVFTAHGWAFTEGVSTFKRLVYAFIERAMLLITDRVVCVSDYDRRLAERWFMHSSSKIITIHNGIADMDNIKTTAQRKNDILRIASVARFAPPKKNLALIQAVEELNKINPNQIEVTLVGDGPSWQECRKYVDDHKLEGVVHFLGRRDDVQNILSDNDVFCLISNYEGLPVSIIEAMRSGMPVIASNVGGCKELVHEGKNGFLIERGDRRQLCKMLDYIKSNPDMISKMGEISRQMYEGDFTSDIMNNKIFQVYEDIRKDCNVT